MKTCPICRSAHADHVTFCPHDGAALELAVGLEPGTVIRRKYQILAEVGRGGMGVVFRARHLLWNEDKAIKVLLDVGVPGAKPSEGLLSEALVLRQIEHPNVVRVEDADFTDDGKLFVVMEYVEGESLRSRMKGGPLPWEKALNLTAQACAGLAAAHRKGIVHRDIKPQNLLLTTGADGREVVKLIDFGIAKVREDAGLGFTGMSTGTTGFFLGTPEYASPEQAMGTRGSDLDARTDLYSLGVVLFEMLTGARPFEGDTLLATLLARLQKVPAGPRQLRPDLKIPQMVSDLALKTIAREKEARFGSAEEMRQAIQTVSDALPATARDRGLKKVRRWIPLAGAVAVVIAMCVWLFWQGQSPMKQRAMTRPAHGSGADKPKVDPPRPLVKTTTAVVPAPAKPPMAAAETAAGETAAKSEVNAADGLKYVWVEPGKFAMGCSPGDTDCNADEKPAHEVTIAKGFWMGETEVTQAAYERVIGNNPSSFQGSQLPVESVSWGQAMSYCKAAGMRLPTEAEWEFAARGGTSAARYGNPGEIAWWSANAEKKTHEVARKQPNGYGLYDLLGNVAEWTADWYEPYREAAATDPRGPLGGEYHVMRGGSWLGGLLKIRASDRVMRKPGVRGSYSGFRCARD